MALDSDISPLWPLFVNLCRFMTVSIDRIWRKWHYVTLKPFVRSQAASCLFFFFPQWLEHSLLASWTTLWEAWLPWGYPAVRRSEPQEGTVDRSSGPQSQLSLALESCQCRQSGEAPWWFQPPAVHLFPAEAPDVIEERGAILAVSCLDSWPMGSASITEPLLFNPMVIWCVLSQGSGGPEQRCCSNEEAALCWKSCEWSPWK